MSAPGKQTLTAAQRQTLDLIDRCGMYIASEDASIASAWVLHDPVTRMYRLTDAGRAALTASKDGVK